MAETVADVVIGVSADVAPLMRETARAGAAVNKFGADMSRNVGTGARGVTAALGQASASAASFGKSFVSGLALGLVSAGLAAVTTNVRQTIGSIADMADEADRVGVSAQNFQELQFGMKLAGVEAEEFSSALSKFSDNLGDAARGSGKLKDVLSENGIALRDASGGVRSTTDLLSDFADMIQRVPDEATRMSLITEAFGKSGKAMTLALSDGSAGLDDMMQAARDAGAVLDDSIVARARELDDQFDALTARVGTFFKAVSVGAAGAVADLAGMLNGLVVPDAADALIGGMDFAGVVGDQLAAAFDANPEMFASARQDILDYGATFATINPQVDTFTDAMGALGDQLLAVGNYGAAEQVERLAAAAFNAKTEFADGVITGEVYLARIQDLGLAAQGLGIVLGDVAGVDFTAANDASAAFDGSIGRLGAGAALAYNNLLALAGLTPTMAGLGSEADNLASGLDDAAREFDKIGNTGAAQLMRDLAGEVRAAAQGFRDGTDDGETFRGKIDQLAKAADAAVSSIEGIDGVTFGGVQAGIKGVYDYLVGLAAQARRTAAAMPGAPGAMEGGGRAEATEPRSTLAPTEVVRPRSFPGMDTGLPDVSAGGGGGGGGSNAALDALITDLETEREILDEWYAESAALLASATDTQLEQLGGRHAAIERLEKEHKERLLAIRGSGDGDALADSASFFNSLATITQAGGDKANKAYRAFAATEALINAYRAASQALATPGIGIFGKFAAYASVLAAGMNLVSALKGGGGSSGGGSSRAPSGGGAASSGGPMSVANITLHGDTFSRSSVEDLFKQINDGLKQGRIINMVGV